MLKRPQLITQMIETRRAESTQHHSIGYLHLIADTPRLNDIELVWGELVYVWSYVYTKSM
jgi:hypothetical protein